MDKFYGLAMGNLWASVHTLRILVNRGLVSPDEVDEVYGSLIEGLQSGDPKFAALFESKLEGIFAEMRGYAQKLWKG
jgi:hypothetical protein